MKKQKPKKQVKKPVAKPNTGEQCPTGYYWNGTSCVKDVG